MARVVVVPVLEDNYSYLVVNGARALAVDPADADRVYAAAEREGVQIEGVLTTHHHLDHAGGNQALSSRLGGSLRIVGGDERVESINETVRDGDVIQVAGLAIKCLATPCHTTGSISYFVEGSALHDAEPIVFTGDTLFVAGCGRFFEGTAEQMVRNMRDVYGSLPRSTRVFPGHEYTVSNLLFAASVEPDNAELQAKLVSSKALRAENKPTVPSTLAEEFAFNPFVRLETSETIRKHVSGLEAPVEVMQALRDMKNSFKAAL